MGTGLGHVSAQFWKSQRAGKIVAHCLGTLGKSNGAGGGMVVKTLFKHLK